MKKRLKWEIVSRCIKVIQFVVIIVGVFFTIYQVREIRSNLDSKEIELIRSYSRDLYSNRNLEIDNAIGNNLPLLVPEGKFTREDLEDYLSVFNSLSYPFDRKLINGEFLCDEFSTSLIRAYYNKEVKSYLYEIRKEDTTYFLGFDQLVEFCEAYLK